MFDVSRCFRNCEYKDDYREVIVDPNEGYVWLQQICLKQPSCNDKTADWSIRNYPKIKVAFNQFWGMKTAKDKLLNLENIMDYGEHVEGSYILRFSGSKYCQP